jgi:hypothetical protein
MDDKSKEALVQLASQILGTVVRGALIAIGAHLATKGLVSDLLANTLAETLSGAAMVLFPIAWGIWQKYSAQKAKEKAIKEALAQPREQWTEAQRNAMRTVNGAA